MNDEQKSFSQNTHKRNAERGNAMVYVLIIVALFAALNFILARGNDTSETNIVDRNKVDFYATQIINYAAQMRDSVEIMSYGGTDINNLTFFQQGDVDFDSEASYSNGDKVYHPLGGGISPQTLPKDLAAPAGATESAPDAGWYVGRFNDVEWSYSSAHDVALVAYRIPQNVCERINEMIAGDTFVPPPQLTGQIRTVLIDNQNTAPPHLNSNGSGHSGGTADFTAAICPACEGVPALCVQNSSGDVFAYYDIIAPQ